MKSEPEKGCLWCVALLVLVCIAAAVFASHTAALFNADYARFKAEEVACEAKGGKLMRGEFGPYTCVNGKEIQQ